MGDRLRSERLMNVVRLAAAALVFVLGPTLPNVGADWVILLGAHLFAVSAAITVLDRRRTGSPRVGQLGMAGDAIAGMGAAVVFADAAPWIVLTTLVVMAWHVERRRLSTDRVRTAARLDIVERIASDVIYEWDLRAGDMMLSVATAAQLGYVTTGRLPRAWWEERLHPDDAGPVRDALATILKGPSREWDMEYRFQQGDGSYTTVHDHAYVVMSDGRRPKPLRMVGSLVNVDSVSLYDPLTRLAGRALFADRVERRVVGVAIDDAAWPAVLAVDLESWRERSAALGTERTQAILTELARRLERHVRDGETVARLGEHRFALLVNAAAPEDAVARGAQVRDSVRVPFNGEVRLDVHVGAAVLAYGEGRELVSQALAALSEAKRADRRVAAYEPGGEERWDRRLELRDDLRGALDRRELRLAFQPMISAATGACRAVEALVRWAHPEHGEIDAADLLPVASDLALRADVDRYVIQEAARSLAQLRKIEPDLRVSVNLSPVTLDGALATSVRATLASALLPGDALTFDLPEDPSLEEGAAAAAIAELRELNVDIAVDDFGTGYASTMLAAIPATEIKIDHVFASRVATDEEAFTIVRNAVARAHDRGMRLVAEGVEDARTAEVLRELGVDLVQGRAVGEPMPFEDLVRWLRAAAAAVPTPVTDPEPAPEDARMAVLRRFAELQGLPAS